MRYWGKIICGICGLLIGGPFGLFLGLVIGHFIDRSFNIARMGASGTRHAEAQRAFFDATFLVMGHLAKVDGRVSEAEIRAARAVMDRMGLTAIQKQRAIELFNTGKQPDFSLDQTLARLIAACQHNRVLLQLFVELQAQAAMADGQPAPAKQQVLQMICKRLGFAPLSFVFYEDFFNFQQRAYQQQHQGYQSYQGYREPLRAKPRVDDAYALLGISASASDADVKRAYRRLMSQHHPDKLIAKGLPEEMLKLATEKTQNIKAAYDCICAARGTL